MLPKIEVCGQSTKCARSLVYFRVFLIISKENVNKINWKWFFLVTFKVVVKA